MASNNVSQAKGIVEQLWHAALAGDLSTVESLVKICPSINVCVSINMAPQDTSKILHSAEKYYGDSEELYQQQNSTPLWAACFSGHLKIVEILVEHGADIENVNANQETALMVACRMRDIALAKYLLLLKVDVNRICGLPVRTVIHICAEMGYLDMIKLLVKYNADVNVVNYAYCTATHIAIDHDYLHIVEFLVEHGANIEITNFKGYTCLLTAVKRSRNDIVRYLIANNANINANDDLGRTAMHMCAITGNLSILQILLNNGALIKKNNKGETPILTAAIEGQRKVVDFFLECAVIDRKAKIDAMELFGVTCIDSYQLDIGRAYWASAARARDSDVPFRSENIEKSLSIRVHARNMDFHGLITAQEKLIKQALAVRLRILGPEHPDSSWFYFSNGRTFAESGRFEKALELWEIALDLVQNYSGEKRLNGDDIIYEISRELASLTSSGRSPKNYELILKVFCSALEEAISRRTDDSISTLFLPIALYCMEMLRIFLEWPNTVTNLKKGFAKAVLHLIKFRCPLSLRTALHASCSKPYGASLRSPGVDMASMLLEFGADPNLQDVLGNTPLHCVAMKEPLRLDLAKLLLDAGAHIDVMNNDRETFASMTAGSNEVQDLVNTTKYTSLACLAARVIRENNIPYTNAVPSSLVKFISQH